MAVKICTIFIVNGTLDDDYNFFEDGTVERVYDQSNYKLNQVSRPVPSEISDHKKVKLLAKCPEEFKKQIETILYPM